MINEKTTIKDGSPETFVEQAYEKSEQTSS